MSVKTVRQALQTFLTTPAIPGVEAVYRSAFGTLTDTGWKLSSNNGWGAVLVLHIPDSQESRATLPAVAGSKAIDHKVGVLVLFQQLTGGGTVATAPDAWVDNLDDVLEAVEARLRSDPTAGTGAGGAIFQQSQDPGDLHVQRDLPKMLPGKLLSWQVIETTAREIITA